jgi:hypothetical protein
VRRSDDGGIIVYDELTDTGHVLNAATAIVFDACDGFTTIEEMARRVSARTLLPEDVELVLVALAELRDNGLLENNDPTTQALSSIKPGISRRQVLQRLALGAAAVAIFPTVLSIKNASVLATQAGAEVFAAVALTLVSPGTPVDLTLSATGVPGPGTVAFEVVSTPSYGTVSINGAVLTYTPTAGYVGPDEMTYRALFYPAGTVTTTPTPTTTVAPTTSTTTTTTTTTTPALTTTSSPAPTTTQALTTTPNLNPVSVRHRNNKALSTSSAAVASTAAVITITVAPAGANVPKFTG